MSDNANYTLVVPFLTDEPLFAFGVEYGLLFARMSDPNVNEIHDYCSIWLQEQITLTANRCGWRIVEMSTVDECWFWLRMKRSR